MESSDHLDSAAPQEPPVTFELEDGSKVVRKGYCSSCGWCCEIVARALVQVIPADEEYARIRNLPRVLDIVDPCPKLNAEKRCSIYQNRPQTCRNFPNHPDQIQDSPCTYYFETA